MPRLTPAETQEAAAAYDRARQALWESACKRALGGWCWPGLRGWVRLHDSGFRRSALLPDTPEERALLAEAKRQRERAAFGLLGLVAAFARAHRGAGQGLGRGLVLIAPGGDALQGAYEQVLRGLDRYDPDYRTEAGRSCKASTFVSWYAYKGVQDERWGSADARLTQSALSHWATVEDAERELRQRLGREPDWDEIVEAVGKHAALTARRVSRILRTCGEEGGRVPLDSEDLGPRERPCPDPLPDELLERVDLRRQLDEAAPPGTRRRRVVDALAIDGPRGAAKAAGSRADAEADAHEVRAPLVRAAQEEAEETEPVQVPASPLRAIRPEDRPAVALTAFVRRRRAAADPSLPACPRQHSQPSPTPSPSPTAPPPSLEPCSRSATRGVVRRGSRAGRPSSDRAPSRS